MSMISRLFQKSPGDAEASTPAPPADAAPEVSTGPDPAEQAARELEALDAAIAAGDAALVDRLVTEGSTTAVRQRAAQAVDGLPRLRELLRRVRGGNDSNVYRILASRRDEILARQRDAEALQAEVDAAATALVRHGRRPYDPLYTPTLEAFEKRWQALATHAGAELARQVDAAVAQAREVIRQHHKAIEAQVERERAAAQAAADAAQQRELAQAAAAAAAAEQARLLEAERSAQQEQAATAALAQRTLAGLLRKAQAALNDGNTARAARMRAEFEAHSAAAPPPPAWIARQLQQLDEKLEELKDWKAFSVAPKRDELMQEIEALASSTLKPEALAQRIRGVRNQWRTLAKGAGENLTAEWQERFQAAAARAYEPCRVHFAAQAEQRRANLALRATLVERLTAFAARQAEQGPDWRLVIQVLGEAKQEWRRHAPVDRAASAPLQEQFRAQWSALRAGLDAEYARNIEAKQALIARAAALAASADTRQAIDEAKGLQQRWKLVGIVPRDQDGPLWESFRQHCDALFQRREQESVAHAQGLEGNRAQVQALCDELERIAALEGPALLESVKPLAALRDSFEQLELPRGSARELQQRFRRGYERCHEAIDAQRARDAQRVWIDLLEAARRVRLLALAVRGNADAATCAARRGEAEAAIAAVGHWPKGARAIIDRQLARAGDGGAAAELTANAGLLQRLCVRAEILADLPSPPEAQSLRQAEQLQRLVQSMGQGLHADATQLEALMFEWLAVGPTEDSAEEALVPRFARCFRPPGRR